ncbi:phosphonate ABC transporter ATP-binding protein [Halobacteriales archaeon QS_8_69_26]|nr:MAG: phosphonate ABC transporter ATP-binding protein [Halobacteriales archaeon QS_8_69_26]
MPTVEFDSVSKVYGEDTVALDDIDITIEEGEFVILLGPSGAGKSTMLRVLNGLTQPTTGTVEIGGQRVGDNRSEVGMVFQEHYLIENMSAFANALSGALSRNGIFRSALGFHDREDKLRALEALDTVGLLKEADQRAGSMSGGQKQRVGIARALVQEPELLLADEPVASLDPKAARDVMRYLKVAAQEHDLTTITSLHQVNIAREFGDRFLGLRDGEVIFDGRTGDLTMEVMDEIYYGEDAEAADILDDDGPAAGTGTGPGPDSDLVEGTAPTGEGGEGA